MRAESAQTDEKPITLELVISTRLKIEDAAAA